MTFVDKPVDGGVFGLMGLSIRLGGKVKCDGLFAVKLSTLSWVLVVEVGSDCK